MVVETPTVSVIIPTYNNARYIGECIGSALQQTYPAHEILIIDDGSTDNTQVVLSAYKDTRIQYVAIPHSGVSAARNKGMELASGDYLAFLDSDDRWRPTMLEKQAAMLSHDNSLVCCFTNFVRFVEGTGAVLADQFTFYPELASVRNECHQLGDGYIVDTDPFTVFLEFHDIPAYMQCTTFRRTLIADMRLNESLHRCEDTEFVLRAFMRGKVAFTPEVLVEVRRHDRNITKDTSLMELDTLRALLALCGTVHSSKRRDRLHDRIVKSGIDSATALIRAGRRAEGVAYYLDALRVPGSWARKLKGFARTSHSLLTSMTGIAAHEAG